jgi:hypothetical protein
VRRSGLIPHRRRRRRCLTRRRFGPRPAVHALERHQRGAPQALPEQRPRRAPRDRDSRIMLPRHVFKRISSRRFSSQTAYYDVAIKRISSRRLLSQTAYYDVAR